MLKVLSNILCDLDPKVKVLGQKAGICDGVPSTSALVFIYYYIIILTFQILYFPFFSLSCLQCITCILRIQKEPNCRLQRLPRIVTFQ